MFRCFNCGENASFRCSVCRTIYYCSEKCQGTDWGFHRMNCIPYDSLQDTYLPEEIESPCVISSPHECDKKVSMDDVEASCVIDDCTDESHNRIRIKRARYSLAHHKTRNIYKEHLKKYQREKVSLQQFMKYCSWCLGTAVNCSFCNSTGLIPE